MPALAMPFIYNLREDPRLDSCEWNISFKKSSSLEDLLVFVRKYPDRRINIRFVDGVPMDTLEMLQGSFDNV